MNDIVAEIIGTRVPKLLNFKIKKNGNLILILPLSDGDRDIIEINEVATKILGLCDGHNDINKIVQIIAESHKETEFKTVRNDTIKILRSFEGAKAVTTNL